MRSGWPHTQADHGTLQAEERRGPFGPDISWPTGYSNLEYREGRYRYSAPAAPQRPAVQGEHPYAAFSAAGYGDDGYSDPGYDGPAAQDVGYPQNGYGQPGYGEAGEIQLAYPPPAGRGQHGYQVPDEHQADSRWQGWDYDQPLRYEDEEPADPGRESYQRPAGYGQRDDYRGSDGHGSGGYHAAPAYDPADYNGSAYSRPGIDGPGYDLSGIISTSDFEAFGYDEPSDGRLAYDDPRYDDSAGGAGTSDGARYDDPRYGGTPSGVRYDEPRYDDRTPGADTSDSARYGGAPSGVRYDQARYDDPRGDAGYRGAHRDEAGSAPRFDETRMDLAGFGGARSGETRREVPWFDQTRLDNLWLSDEDVRHEAATGYGDDGFGTDGTVRSGYSFDSGRLDETRLDLGTAPRLDRTRFDVPVLDETRIETMRALDARPSATGLLAPPEDRPLSWDDDTSLDDFGGLYDVPAPAAFVRTEERRADTATRRAVGRRRGRSGDRRQWIALGAIAVVAAGAIGGVLMKYVFSGPSGPAHTVVAPDKADGFTRMPNLEKQMKVDSLAQSIMSESSGHVSDLVPAVYQQGSAVSGANAQIFMFVGGKLAGASPAASVASFEQDYPGARVVPAGSRGGEAVCAQRQLNGEGVSMCVWFDNDTFGALVSPTMTTAKLATTLDSVRPSLELYAK